MGASRRSVRVHKVRAITCSSTGPTRYSAHIWPPLRKAGGGLQDPRTFSTHSLRLVRCRRSHGFPQVGRSIGHLEGSRLWLQFRRPCGYRRVRLDLVQRHKASMARAVCCAWSNELTPDLQDDGSRCSIFSFDVTANKSRLPLARNALRKLRTLRHPGVIKVLDTVEVREMRKG